MYKGIVTKEQIPILKQMVMLQKEKERIRERREALKYGPEPELVGLLALARVINKLKEEFCVLIPETPLPLLYAAYCKAAIERGDYQGLEILSRWGEKNHRWLGLEDAGA